MHVESAAVKWKVNLLCLAGLEGITVAMIDLLFLEIFHMETEFMCVTYKSLHSVTYEHCL
jgi:hypothetical protein